MKLIFWIFSLISIVSFPETTIEGTLRITIENVKKDQGTIMLAVYAEPDNFLSEVTYRSVHHTVNQSGEVSFEIAELPYGDYAISLYHDENDNKELDTNFMRIPKEPYGFSNNARSTFGPPKFKDARFTFSSTKQEIKIEIK